VVKVSRIVSAAAAALAVALTTVGPASATGGSTHCWQDVESQAGACYNTYAEVLTDIARHAALPRAGSVDADVSSEGITPLSTVIIGQVFEDLNYGGSSFTFTASSDCDTNADVDWELSAMPSGWNDRVSSFKSFGQCATRIWQDVGFGGSYYGFVVNSTYVGSTLNDQGSSIQWN
jgi:hypothetical protein